MNQSGSQEVTAQPKGLPRAVFLKWSRLAPVLIAFIAVPLVGGIIVQGLLEDAQLRQNIHEENVLRMQAKLTHLNDFFDSIYSTLLFVSLDPDVVVMRRDSLDYIQKLIDHQWEHNRLAEVYLVERDFTGDRSPFMTFKHEANGQTVQEVPSLDEEREEYHAQIDQIERFAVNPGILALMSGEINLCASDELGVSSRGYVYSVPIRSNGKLAGIVAGMIESQTIRQVIGPFRNQRVALLIDERGEILTGWNPPDGILDWFRHQFRSQGATGFFEKAADHFPVRDMTALWVPATVIPGEKWYLVFLYNERSAMSQGFIGGWPGRAWLVGGLVLAGVALVLLTLSLRKRLVAQMQHLRERKQLERQVQEVSEREQRRIGEVLHEDLCQRLSGLEAAGRMLEKKLKAANIPEAGVASEIAVELRESLTCACRMADELQPVSLLEHGFLAAIQKLADRAEKRAGFPCRVENRGFPGELELMAATHLYRITQEAVSNVIQHAQATLMTISLYGNCQRLSLTITDNGIGMPKGSAQGPGMGLHIMRYRADLIGAQLEIRAAKGGGTAVVCSRPKSNCESNYKTESSRYIS
ncbi:MAG: ATP-binding protein [Candidatus Omnitrophica bacterium]|nr:ATP-binding protein [Candidatus Omnitrophota bacterium]